MTQVQVQRYYSINFQLVSTNYSKDYLINSCWTIGEFIYRMKRKIIHDFNVENFDIINVGQELSIETQYSHAEREQIIGNLLGNELQLSFFICPIE